MNTIQIPNVPIKANASDWLFEHIGRISVAVSADESNDDVVSIIAFSDCEHDSRELRKIAQKEQGFLIRNISQKGVTYVDCQY